MLSTNKWGILLAVLLALLLISFCIVMLTPAGRAAVNTWDHTLRKVDDATRYETRKKVEDTCRNTIVSYESDKATWERYKDHEDTEQRGWADAALLRANKAAIQYNDYFLKNSYVFEGNVPDDIRAELPLLG